MSYTYEQLGEISFRIITFAGEAKSEAMLAIFEAKKGNFEEANNKIEKAHKELLEAERQHAELVQQEAAGMEIKIPLLLMHAEDQLLSTQTLILMATEIIDLHKKIK
ncbi:MAG: PTS lactose/cellobiose transporter subunit IIA [Metamycoplasmataceae bacterium]